MPAANGPAPRGSTATVRTVPALPPAQAGSKKSSRKISWDIVRAGCVVLVMLYHATFLSTCLHPELGPRGFVFPYQVGASMLLVLSAYFACVTIGRGSLLRYWWGRIARLLPPFFAAVVIIFLLLRAFPAPGWFYPLGGDLPSNLLMLWNWKPQDYLMMDGSHWTIPLQLMAFTLAPLLYRGRWGHGKRLVWVLWIAVLLPIAQWWFRISNPPEPYRVLADGFGFHRWHLFVAGVAIWMWSTRRLSTRHFTGLFSMCMVAHALHNFTRTPTGDLYADWGSTVAVCIGLVVVALTARRPDWERGIPRWAHRPIQWFAGVSYGVFLMHQTVGYLVIRTLHDLGLPDGLQTVGLLGTGVLLGWLLTRLVERPMHRFLMETFDRWSIRSRPAVAHG